ncbi:leucine-rich repeat and transmembrane domain-containing protein 2 [Cephus cinctus]|uniref:Leucine-rich repeat and transmembrane domain-containing protein 2 n=1 Tax=Cephus cinctus TaxID=211228 RepID=A0AAJ7BWU1_CEPCN|nr:leucine-rich repeat and transmembrane domain-containing protein 2 [Cephus cinctus]XP_015595527.1 leucine-rich repeat and transmembrane domain-containing protein 2 [Cephus cinctus]
MPGRQYPLVTLALILGASFLEVVTGQLPKNSARSPCHVHEAVTRCYDVDIEELEVYLVGTEEESHTLEITHSNLSILSREPFHAKTDWEVLYMARNNISEIEYDAFHRLHKVVSVNLERNLLRTIDPKTFSYCYLLLKLILSYNPLVLPDEPFLEAYKLEYLDLSFANLTNLPLDTFKLLVKLRYLNISHNRLEVLDREVFVTLQQLEVLDVANNNFKVIDYRVFFMYSLMKLNNEWVCDCDLKIVFYKIFENATLTPEAVKCAKPFNTTWLDMRFLDCTNHIPDKTLFSSLDEYYEAIGVDKRVSSPEEPLVPPGILVIILSSLIVVLLLVLALVLICWCRTRDKVKINHPEEHSLDTSWQYGTVLMHRAGHDPGKNPGSATLTVSAPVLQYSTMEGIPMTSIRPTAPRMSDVYQRIDPAEHDVSYSDQEADDVALYERMH